MVLLAPFPGKAPGFGVGCIIRLIRLLGHHAQINALLSADQQIQGVHGLVVLGLQGYLRPEDTMTLIRISCSSSHIALESGQNSLSKR